MNEIRRSILSVSFFLFEINYIWIQLLNKYMTSSHIHVTTCGYFCDGLIANTVTYCSSVCDSVFHMHDCLTQLDLVTWREKKSRIRFLRSVQLLLLELLRRRQGGIVKRCLLVQYVLLFYCFIVY